MMFEILDHLVNSSPPRTLYPLGLNQVLNQHQSSPAWSAGFHNQEAEGDGGKEHDRTIYIYIYILVGGIPTPLKNMTSSVGITYSSQYMEK